MRVMWKAEVLALALVAVVALSIACDGDDGGPGGGLSPQPIEGGLPATFPEDFPLYPNLNVVRSSPLGERYIVEASSEDPVEDVVDFYERELTEGRWELLETDDSTEPGSTTLSFTAPDFPVDGRVLVSEDAGDSARTIVGIAMPIDIARDD